LSAPLRQAGAYEGLKSAITYVIPLDRYVILSLDLETETFRQGTSGFSYDPDLIVANNPRQTYAGSITVEVVRTGTTQIVNSDDPRVASGEMPLSQMVFEQGYRSLMAVPLRFEREIIGTFVCSRRDGVYLEEDILVGERIGSLLAGALTTFGIITERDRALAARSEIEKRHSAVLEAEANIGRVLSSPSGRARGVEALRTKITRVIATDRILITALDLETETCSREFDQFLDDFEVKLVNNIGKSYFVTCCNFPGSPYQRSQRSWLTNSSRAVST
jgi:transcriptional regulator with GAF, ATPase, and Fis domain